MSLVGIPNLKCQHKHLTKKSSGLYKCIQCNKEFVMIPAKSDPIIKPDFPPHSPPRYPRYPHYRDPHYMQD